VRKISSKVSLDEENQQYGIPEGGKSAVWYLWMRKISSKVSLDEEIQQYGIPG
jgi:hypothetical protein